MSKVKRRRLGWEGMWLGLKNEKEVEEYHSDEI
jgi:hypothetical protein